MHTNISEGTEPHHGRRRQLSDTGVEEVLQDIRRIAGAVELQPMLHSAGAEGAHYVEKGGILGLPDSRDGGGLE